MKRNVYVLNILIVCALLLSSLSFYAGPSASASPDAPDALVMPPPIIEFPGIGRDDVTNDPGFTQDTIIPDTSGAAGHTHYLQAANSSVALYRKNGALIASDTFNNFWTLPVPPAGDPPHSVAGTACDGANAAHHGQPYVLYDHMARRWVVADVAYTNIDTGPYYICVAITKGLAAPLAPGAFFTSDFWYYYAVQTTQFEGDFLYPDMPKLGLWNNGYYMSVNLLDIEDSGMNRTARGVQVFALDRNVMVRGQDLGMGGIVQFYLPETRNFRNLTPTNLLGVPPDYGAPNYFAAAKPDKFYLWEFSVDWRDPSAATFGQALNPNYSINTDTSEMWTTGYTVPQFGTNERVEVHGERVMSPLQYRIVDGIPSLWATHTVAVDPLAGDRSGLRWYELQFADDGTPNFYQTGTYAGPQPETDSAYRWLPSLGVDKAGDMAIGFSISDPAMGLYPSIRYAGRLRSSFSGELPLGEATLYQGTTFQDNVNTIIDGPWGRQSHMSIDPLDECVFWYTNMYYDALAPTPNQNWRTRIGWFSLTECRGGMTTRVSLSSANAQGNAASGLDFGQYGMDSVAISANGRYVAFASAATTLVAGDTNGFQDVFIRDRDFDGDGVFDEPGSVDTKRITAPGDVQLNGHAWEVSMSSNGRYVAFSSEATNLVTGDSNGFRDVFVYDRTNRTTERVSVADNTPNGSLNGWSDQPFISGNGQYVAFRSNANNAVPGDTNTVSDVFIRHLAADRTYRVSLNAGIQLVGESATPTLSETGLSVAFATKDPTLGPGDDNIPWDWDVFVSEWTIAAAIPTPVSTVVGGGAMGDLASYTPFISGDGQHVAFISMATNLLAVADTNGFADVYVWDRNVVPAVTQRVSLNFFGSEANGNSYSPSISADGRFIAFASEAGNLDSFLMDFNAKRDVFLHDRSMVTDGIYDVGLTQRISLDVNRGEPNNWSFGPIVASQGRHVAFVSDATDLVTNDTNTKWDVFAYDSERTLPILLKIPGNITGEPGGLVSVPVIFDSDSQLIDTTVFSVDYDQTCLVFDPAVAGAVTWNLPSAFIASYTFSAADTNGELDFSIHDQVSPRSPLPDGTLVTFKLRIKSTCAAAPGSTNAARVGFSVNPAPSFGSAGESVKGVTLDGFVTIQGGRYGDCNGDGRVDAGDLSAFVLEFFDGDDVSPLDVPNGTFPGNPVGCNPNQDNLVDAGDLSCTVLIIWGNGSAGCAGSAPGMPELTVPLFAPETSTGARLSLPATMPVKAGYPVTLPLTLDTSGASVSSLVFSIDIDDAWLAFNPTDGDHNGQPDALVFELPAGFTPSVAYNASDSDGELDFVIYNLADPQAQLPDGVILHLTLTTGTGPGEFFAQVKSSTNPQASFGSTSGLSLPGILQAGQVWISDVFSNLYVPLLLKD